MFKYILVPATGADTDEPMFSTALAVARQSGSHLVFLHVRIDVQQVLMAMATADMGGGVSYDRIIETLEEDVATRQKKAERAFHDFCERGATRRIERPDHPSSLGGVADGARRRADVARRTRTNR